MDSENSKFVERFVEVCGTREPAKIQRLLNISYQAARNYLQGRLPDTYVLRTIARQTPYSLNWLLTGDGEKFVSTHSPEDTPLSVRQVRALVREECREAINELVHGREVSQHKVVILQPDNLRSEKIKESSSLSEKEG